MSAFKKNFNQFYLKFFNLEIQFECTVFIKNYYIKFLKFFQNLINQHDHKYLIIQHAVTHADRL